MNEVLAIALQGMQADMARVEQLGMNVANSLTAGYKRRAALQSPVGSSFAAQLSGIQARAGSDEPGDVRVLTDTRPGTLRFTGQALDLAVAGAGYFEVQTDSGPAYTRQGSFRVDGAGRLVNLHGHQVVGQGGPISLPMADPVITASGAITARDGTVLAQLKVVEFEPGAGLLPTGDGVVVADAAARSSISADPAIRQGYLENSNTSFTHEMTQLVRTMRHFETMNKVAQGYDDMLGTAIRKLGENNV